MKSELLAFDTNVLIYAVDEDSKFFAPCLHWIEEARRDPSPAFLTWNVCYEFLRVSTHPRVLRSPMSSAEAWRFIRVLLDSRGFALLHPTERHAAVLSLTLSELPYISGNAIHDLHTAVVMRENGISRICTRDTDFYRFPFLDVIDPLQ
ncbi:MAG: PIN domain-containing protein [Chloroflexi bacterium]|nr:PIN domain-containing protein [Chloroflexota bacterium]